MDDFAESAERRRVWRLLAVVLVLIAYGSLYPFYFLPVPSAMLAWVWQPGLPGIRDAITNLAVYFPLGFLLFRVAQRKRITGFASRSASGIVAATLVSLAVSATLECLQSFDKGRVSSRVDLLLNVTGGVLGALTASFLPSRIPASLAVLLLAIIARTYPLFPNIHPHLSTFHAPQAVFAAVDWLTVRVALAVYLKRNAVTRELAALELVIPARIFIIDQATSWSDIVGALVALTIGHLGLDRLILRPQQWAPFMLLTVIARELQPFHFSPRPQAFHWIPFETLLTGPPAAAVLFLTKLLLYGSVLWLLDPEGRRIWRYGATVAGLIAALEWMQCYLPGRTPDITDSIIVLIAACALSALRPQATPSRIGTLHWTSAIRGAPAT